MKYILILIIFLTSCNKANTEEVKKTRISPYEMYCEQVGQIGSNFWTASISRCENKEVVCYMRPGSDSHYLDCKWKKDGKIQNT